MKKIIEKCQPYSDDGDLCRLWEPAMEAFRNCSPEYPAVEIGIRAGGSSMLLMNAIAQTSKLRKLICVDNYGQEQYRQFFPEIILTLRETAMPLGISYDLHKTTSREWIDAQLRFTEQKYSLVYLDGCHLMDEVKYELFYFLPRIAPGGYLIIDNENWVQENGKAKWENCLRHQFDREKHVRGVKVIWRKE